MCVRFDRASGIEVATVVPSDEFAICNSSAVFEYENKLIISRRRCPDFMSRTQDDVILILSTSASGKVWLSTTA